MLFKYSCFISYHCGQSELMEAAVFGIYRALSDEIAAYTRHKPVYLDKSRIQVADFFNQELATALCQSVCMIAIYTPAYLDKQQTYCAREYRAMEKLEKKRLSLLPNVERVHGLIIPIVIRGEDKLPALIRDNRQYINFDRFQLRERKMSYHPFYASKIKRVAEYVAARCEEFEKLENDLRVDCSKYKFPDDKEVLDWLEPVPSTQAPFPMRVIRK